MLSEATMSHVYIMMRKFVCFSDYFTFKCLFFNLIRGFRDSSEKATSPSALLNLRLCLLNSDLTPLSYTVDSVWTLRVQTTAWPVCRLGIGPAAKTNTQTMTLYLRGMRKDKTRSFFCVSQINMFILNQTFTCGSSTRPNKLTQKSLTRREKLRKATTCKDFWPTWGLHSVSYYG